MSELEEQGHPLVTIASGNPTDEEIAAVTAVLWAAAAASATPRPVDDRPIAGGWKTHWRGMRRNVQPGREAWRFSARP